MKRTSLKIEDVKNQIDSIKGKEIKMLVNKGRKKMVRYEGTVVNVYPSLFTVEVLDDAISTIHTYSYAEILCGNVRICPKA